MTTGVLTLDELGELVRNARTRARPEAGDTPRPANCLGLPRDQFEAVVAELERLLHIPLLTEVQRCDTAEDFVAYVNSQATSAA